MKKYKKVIEAIRTLGADAMNRWLKYLLAFLWFVLVDIIHEIYKIPRFIEFVVVATGLALIFYLFEKSKKK